MFKNTFKFASFALITTLLFVFTFSTLPAWGDKNTRVIVDMAGRIVKIPENPHRVVSAYWIGVTLIYSINASDYLVGSNYKPLRNKILLKINPHTKEIIPVGDRKNLNVETIFSLNPDLYITNTYLIPTEKKIEKSGIPIVCIDTENPDNLTKAIRLLGKILNKEENAESIIKYYKDNLAYINNIIAKIPEEKRQKVYLVGTDKLRTVGVKYYQNYLMENAGGINVARNIKKHGWINVSMEDVLKWNPDVIVIVPYSKSKVKDILSDPKWQSISAVKNHRVYRIPKYIAPWDFPGPESILGTMWLSIKLYPDMIKFNMSERVKEFYKRFFNYNMPNKDIEKILSE